MPDTMTWSFAVLDKARYRTRSNENEKSPSPSVRKTVMIKKILFVCMASSKISLDKVPQSMMEVKHCLMKAKNGYQQRHKKIDLKTP
jgi:hypothetical protein